MPVTLNAGFRMPSWFDLRSLDDSGPEDEDGIKQAAEQVRRLITEEVNAGIPISRIMLGGFSQGGALALYSALTNPQKLAGVMALSCWLPLHKTFPKELKACNKDLPIIQCHGNCDPIVPYKWGAKTSKLLSSLSSKTEFKTYKEMMHTSNEEEMKDLRIFIEKYLPSV